MNYIPHTESEIGEMLELCKTNSIEALFSSIPNELMSKGKIDIPDGISEQACMAELKAIGSKNRDLQDGSSFLGAGAYRHYIPAAVSELSSRSEFVTPYTPYQPEISQGTLQVLFEYQSLIARLFSMDVSNASHYSGATAFADAALMARRIGKQRSKIIVPTNIHPEYRAILKTVLGGSEDIIEVECRDGSTDIAKIRGLLNSSTAAVAVQFPNFFGVVEDFSALAEEIHKAGSLLIAICPEPIAFGILMPPGEWGADIAVGEGLSLGLPVSFGGPTLGLFTVKQALVRQMPGRLCGKTTDAEGRDGYVLTLSTREQHIRREKATSNICSNQALCATTAAIYLSLLGREGMKELSALNASLSKYAREIFAEISGVTIPFSAPTFNEFVYETRLPAELLLSKLAASGIRGGVDLGRFYPEMKNRVLVCTTEMNSRSEIDSYADKLKAISL